MGSSGDPLSWYFPELGHQDLSEADVNEERIVVEQGLEARVAQIATPVIEDLGFRLVRVKVSARDGGTLQIMAERPDGFIGIDELEEISRNLAPVLDVADPIPTAYRLEVSSPGMDRPLVRRTDFVKATGHVIKLEMRIAVGGRKRFQGTVLDVTEDAVHLRLDDSEDEAILRLDDVSEARLVLTDDLIRDTLRAEKKAKKEFAEAKAESRKAAKIARRRASQTAETTDQTSET